MKMYKEGDHSRAICANCGQLRSITFQDRDVPLSSGRGIVHGVIVGVCDVCKETITIPQQSAPRIKETLAKAQYSLEARIPRHLLDALGLACHDLGFGTDSATTLFRFYLLQSASTAARRNRLRVLASSEEAKGKATARFSAKLNDHMVQHLRRIENDGISKAEAVKGIILKIKNDVLDEKSKVVRSKLRAVMELVA